MHVQWFWAGGSGLEGRDWASSVNILVAQFSRETPPLFCQKLLETGSLYVHFWAWDFLDPAECKSKGKTWGRLVLWLYIYIFVLFCFVLFSTQSWGRKKQECLLRIFVQHFSEFTVFCRGFLSLCRTKVFFISPHFSLEEMRPPAPTASWALSSKCPLPSPFLEPYGFSLLENSALM